MKTVKQLAAHESALRLGAESFAKRDLYRPAKLILPAGVGYDLGNLFRRSGVNTPITLDVNRYAAPRYVWATINATGETIYVTESLLIP